MSREWKPGDVALVNDTTKPDAEWEPATCVASRTREQEATWILHRNGGRVWGSVSQARPLVVIDPEDREQVERLYDTFTANYVSASPRDSVIALQAALREFADPKPPKPEEPTGLGAVVEDGDGVTWIRCFSADIKGSVWRRSGDRAADRAAVTKYADINVVRVLSEGVQP